VIVAGVIKRHRKSILGIAAAVAAIFAVTWFVMRRPPAPAPELKQTRLTFNSSDNPVGGNPISPDGKYLAYSDSAGIHVKLLSTGEERAIPKPPGTPNYAIWDVDAWFPDGTQVLAHTYEPGGNRSIWTASVMANTPRKLRDRALGWDVSPDGTYIAFTPGASDYPRELWIMTAQGENPHKVLALGESEWLDTVRRSPDGQRLAYLKTQRTPGGGSQGIGIETCDVKGANRTVVVSYPDWFLDDYSWLPDGRIVYSQHGSPNSQDGNLWEIRVDTDRGTPIGKPKRMTQWAGSFLGNLHATADGKRLVLTKVAFQGQVYVGELAAKGTRMNIPRRFRTEETDDWPTGWTADSKAVLFDSRLNGAVGIFKQGINEDTAERLTGTQDALFPRLSPDGAWILYVHFPKVAEPSAPIRLMRIPVTGGMPQLVLEMEWLES
jgi:Tol biopolymer transport system component